MNTFRKSGVGRLLVVVALTAVSAASHAGEVFGLPLPNVSALVAQADAKVSQDVARYLRAAAAAPKKYFARRSPTVEVSAIETVIVQASRIAPIETVVVAATRLPTIETVVVEATRLPIETIVVEATRLPPADDATVVVASATPVRL